MKDWRVGSLVCIVVGAAIGMAFGFALDNPVALAGVGAAIGIAFYLAMRDRF